MLTFHKTNSRVGGLGVKGGNGQLSQTHNEITEAALLTSSDGMPLFCDTIKPVNLSLDSPDEMMMSPCARAAVTTNKACPGESQALGWPNCFIDLKFCSWTEPDKHIERGDGLQSLSFHCITLGSFPPPKHLLLDILVMLKTLKKKE